MTISLKEMNDQALALKQQGKLYEAIDLYKETATSYPDSAVAEHNLAAALGDVGRATEAESRIRRAFAKGLNAAESWLVLARALLAQGRLSEAEEAFKETLKLNPDMTVALYELVQLIWMSTADVAIALAPLEAAIAANPDKPELHGSKARVLMYTAGARTTHDFVTSSLQRWPNDGILLGVGIDSACQIGKTQSAIEMSDRLIALHPDSTGSMEMRALALLAAGRADEVLPIAKSMCAADPNNQHALALLATASRLLGDARYEELYNYEEFVRSYELAVPNGWDSLESYLIDLGAALRKRHPFVTHPFSNSEEHGSKISDLLEMDSPAIKALRDAITPAVDGHLAYLGSGTDPLRSRNSGRWKIDGIWSVWLKPNGYHHNHVHPAGWLSSACYIELPNSVSAAGQEGWIKFGEPGVVTEPKLGHEDAVQPEPGKLVIFPSYMWHGTVPFSGAEPRLTIAFDIIPA